MNSNQTDRRLFWRALLTSIVGCFIASFPSFGSDDIRTIVDSTQDLPGLAPSELDYATGVIGDSGHIIVFDILNGLGSGGDGGTARWIADPKGQVNLLVRGGLPAPGRNVGEMLNAMFRAPHGMMDQLGNVVVPSLLRGDGISDANDEGFWFGTKYDDLRLGIRDGDPAPGIDGAVYRDLGFPALKSNGEFAFSAFVTGGGVSAANDLGLWSWAPGSQPTLLLREGDPAPGTTLSFGGIGLADSNPDGDKVLLGQLIGAPTSQDGGIWRSSNGGPVELLAREGEHAPGTQTGVVFSHFPAPAALAANGMIAFRGELSGPGVTSENMYGIWIGTSAADLSLVVRSGDPIPEGTPTKTFAPVGNPQFDDAGRLYFGSDRISSSGVEGLWKYSNGTIENIVKIGDVVEGPSGEVTIAEFYSSDLNGAGQIAFGAVFGYMGLAATGVWATDRRGQINLVVSEYQTIDVDSGPDVDIRQVDSLYAVSLSSNFISDRGEVVFEAGFGSPDNVSGVYVSRRVAIPEPTGLMLTVALLFALACSNIRISPVRARTVLR